MPHFIEIKETFDVRTYACTYVQTFETSFIQSTLSKSRPKNDEDNKDDEVKQINIITQSKRVKHTQLNITKHNVTKCILILNAY